MGSFTRIDDGFQILIVSFLAIVAAVALFHNRSRDGDILGYGSKDEITRGYEKVRYAWPIFRREFIRSKWRRVGDVSQVVANEIWDGITILLRRERKPIMSVASRRESDQEHREPRFERPIPPGLNLVTPGGLTLIDAQVAAVLTAARAAGEGQAADELRRDLRYWRARQASTRVTPATPGDEAGSARASPTHKAADA